MLGEQEYTKFAAKLRELTELQLAITDKHGTVHPERLQGEERVAYNQLLQELEIYFDKVSKSYSVEDQLEKLTIEESQKRVSFPIKNPRYVPEGYMLNSAVGTIWKDGSNQIPAITITYKKGNETILVTLDQLENNDQPHMPQRFEKETD